jgi:aldehyde:ferredoxin oxidoreductase
MELYERGVLTEAQTGMPLPFGSGDALVRMTEATAYREGFGDALAEGSKRMGETLGHPEVFMGVKGQEFPAYDPRGFQGMGVAYATCNRGACHLRAWTPGIESAGVMPPHAWEGKGTWVAHEQDTTTVHDATGMCLFVGAGGLTLADIRPILCAATGVDWSLEDLQQAGERIWNLERVWNMRAGLTRQDDNLPQRLLKEAHKSGPSKGVLVNLEPMLVEYYTARGWTPDGAPPAEKLQELGIPA